MYKRLCIRKFFPEGSHLVVQTQSSVEEKKNETRKKLSEGLFSSDPIITVTKTEIGSKNASRDILRVSTEPAYRSCNYQI